MTSATKVIVTLTTIPSRIDGALKVCLNQLCNLTYDDYEIHVNVPAKYSQTGEAYVVPDWLRAAPKVRVFDGLDDLGPRTKIVPTLQRVIDPRTVIITADDDVLYKRDFIEYHLKKRAQHPGSAIGFAGVVNSQSALSVDKDVKVDVLENYKTASYERGLFKDDFFERYVDQLWNDDIVVSAYCRDNGIDRWVVNYDRETYFRPRVNSYPVINLIPCEYGGCDLMRGLGRKNTFNEIQVMYDNVG